KQKLTERLGLKPNSAVLFVGDDKEKVTKLTGLLRNEAAKRAGLVAEKTFEFCWVNDFPMFEHDEETDQIVFSHNPFSMPQGGLEALNTKNPLDILAYQYDIVCNGIELCSGAVRNHSPEIMVKAFEIAGYDKEIVETKFPALFNAFKFGAPPHAGMAPGVDRIVMLLADEQNIREVIAFPMNKNAEDLLMGAPSTVTQKQLDELGIMIKPDTKK
ncbi:MAG TPA: Asp-tRNA(Asn)/Glu-tRNA(Gln) amidotransferase GatCAB subunit C, partial [Eubacteriales bacterium]|nr:Asp-tRNA(Asn)/Glu-tRNA(Gln) amidotransferase GatCAB subunit C [Eubacteriales bacterium]